MRTSHALFAALLLSNGALCAEEPRAVAVGVSVNVGVGGNSSSASSAVTTSSSATAATSSTTTTTAKQTQKEKAKATTSKKKAKAKPTSKKKAKAKATSKEKTKSTKSATTSSQPAPAPSKKQSSQAPAQSQPAAKSKHHAATGSSPATVVAPTSSSPAAGASSATYSQPATSSNPEGIIGQSPTKHSKTTPVDTSIQVYPSASAQFSASVEFTFNPGGSGAPSGSFTSAEFTFHASGSESFVPPLPTESASSVEAVSGYAISTALSPSFVASLTPPSGAPTTLTPSYTQYSAIPSLGFSSIGVESSSTQSYNPYLTASVSSSSGQSVFTFHHHTYHLGPETLTAGHPKPTEHNGGPKKNDTPSKSGQGWLAAAAVCVVSGLVALL